MNIDPKAVAVEGVGFNPSVLAMVGFFPQLDLPAKKPLSYDKFVVNNWGAGAPGPDSSPRKKPQPQPQDLELEAHFQRLWVEQAKSPILFSLQGAAPLEVKPENSNFKIEISPPMATVLLGAAVLGVYLYATRNQKDEPVRKMAGQAVKAMKKALK